MRRASLRSLLLGGTMLLAGLFAGSLTATQAHAHISICRRDPILTLSNGAQLTLYTDTSTDATNMKLVTFAVHLPKTITVKSILYDQSGQEKVTLFYDQAPGLYTSY